MNYYIIHQVADNTSLCHYGIAKRSGRYPYGSGQRPYQRLDKSQSRKSVAETPEERKKRLEENRGRVMKSGKASEVMEYIPEMSIQEIQSAVQRIQWTNQLDKLSKQEATSYFDNLDKAMTKVGKVNNWIGTGVKSYKYASIIFKLLKSITPTFT